MKINTVTKKSLNNNSIVKITYTFLDSTPFPGFLLKLSLLPGVMILMSSVWQEVQQFVSVPSPFLGAS